MENKKYRHMIPLATGIPSIDLHGENKESAEYFVKRFINDHYKLKTEKIVIIHGIGTGTLKKVIHDILKKDKRIEKYYLDYFNAGCTIVEYKNNN